MALTSGQVRVAGTGELFLGPVGTTLPTAADADLDPALTGYGYTDESGVVLSKSIEREGIMAWQSLTPVRYLTTSQELTAACTFLQSNRDILKLWLGSGDFATDGGTGYRADIPVDPTGLQFAAVIRWQDDDITSLLTIPKVEISETGDVSLARAATSFPITFSALTPDSGDVLASWMTTDPAFAPPAPAGV